jgi:hypothetical protein
MTITITCCDRYRPHPLSEVIGSYVYRLSTGEVEVLTLNRDQTFRHDLYKDSADYKKGNDPLFEERREWFLQDDAIRLHMSPIFNGDFPAQANRSTSPRLTDYSAEGLWWEQHYGDAGRAAILLNEERDYILYRVENPMEIDSMRWQY